MSEERLEFCPMIKGNCKNVDCAWFKEGDCCILVIPDLFDKLEELNEKIDSIKNTVEAIEIY